MYQSFRPKGVEEESFRGKTANVLDADRLAKLDAFLEEAGRTARVPGVPARASATPARRPAHREPDDRQANLARSVGLRVAVPKDFVAAQAVFTYDKP